MTDLKTEKTSGTKIKDLEIQNQSTDSNNPTNQNTGTQTQDRKEVL